MIDLTGFKNERLQVVSLNGRDKFKKITWNCICSCGKNIIRKTEEIRSGIPKSCGCYIQSRPGNKYKHESNTSHGYARKENKHPLYVVWMGVKQRCYNPKNSAYKYYGGKGISICDEWKSNFVSFMNWCLINNWKCGLTIDRIDSSGNYHPDNCRILTKSENSKRLWNDKPEKTVR